VACSCHQLLLQIQRSYRFSCHERAPRRMDVTMSRHVVEKADGRARLIRATTGNGPRPCGCPIRRLNLTMKEHVQRRTLLNEGNNAPARAITRGPPCRLRNRRSSARTPACPRVPHESIVRAGDRSRALSLPQRFSSRRELSQSENR